MAYSTSTSPYESGYNHGCDDAQISDRQTDTLTNRKKAQASTDEFMNGYNEGFAICLSEIGNNKIIDEQSNGSNSFVNNTGQVHTPNSSANETNYTGANGTIKSSEDNSVWVIGFGALVFAIIKAALWENHT